jgi:hypothetical protein
MSEVYSKLAEVGVMEQAICTMKIDGCVKVAHDSPNCHLGVHGGPDANIVTRHQVFNKLSSVGVCGADFVVDSYWCEE